MNGMDLILLALSLSVGAALGVLAARARSVGVTAERDAARAERDRLRAERDAAQAESGALEDRLRQTESENVRLAAELDHARTGQEKLADEFQRLSGEALRRNSEQFLQLAGERLKSTEQRTAAELDQRRQAVEALVKPLSEQLDKITSQVNDVERARTTAYAELRSQLESMGKSSEQLRLETRQLVTALRAPQVRGRWGELQLRNVVEHAGMLEHVDFDEQASVDTADGRLRPDLVVKLADNKRVVVDAKVSFSGFLEAQEARDDETRAERLKAHARHLKSHIDLLAAKEYQEQFTPTPEFVVMFVPSEVFLSAALEQEPALYEHAFERNVVLATPTTLVALLRTVAYTWRQEALARNAQQVLDLGRELHSRLSTLGGHVGKLGRQLDSAVRAYNDTVASMESRVLVTARKMTDLKVVDDELEGAIQVERSVRQLQAPELVASASEALVALDDIETDSRYGVGAGAGIPRSAKDGTTG